MAESAAISDRAQYESALHPAFTVLFDALAEVSVEHDKALHRKIDDLKKCTHELVRASLKEMKVRFDEMETVFRTKHQADQERYAETMQQVQRLTGIEASFAELRAIVDDIRRELTTTFNASSARINELESLYDDQRQQSEKHAEQTKLLTDRLTAVEQQTGDLKCEVADVLDGQQRLDARCDELQSKYQRQRQSDEQCVEQIKTLSDRLTATERQDGDLRRDVNDGNKRLNDLEDTYWSNREKDQRQRDEQAKAITDKVTTLERQTIDFAHELKEVRR